MTAPSVITLTSATVMPPNSISGRVTKGSSSEFCGNSKLLAQEFEVILKSLHSASNTSLLTLLS